MTVKELREWLERFPEENTAQMRDDTGDWNWCVDVETLGQYVYISGTNKDGMRWHKGNPDERIVRCLCVPTKGEVEIADYIRGTWKSTDPSLETFDKGVIEKWIPLDEVLSNIED